MSSLWWVVGCGRSSRHSHLLLISNPNSTPLQTKLIIDTSDTSNKTNNNYISHNKNELLKQYQHHRLQRALYTRPARLLSFTIIINYYFLALTVLPNAAALAAAGGYLFTKALTSNFFLHPS